MRISATFTGRSQSAGYQRGKRYTLSVTELPVERHISVDSPVKLAYSSLAELLSEWQSVSKVNET